MSKGSLMQRGLEYIYEHFKKDTGLMLIITGAAGWILSSGAQMLGIIFNPKIPREQKGFLLPQEFFEALTNIVTFLGITYLTKKSISKMASTGKIAPQSVRDFLNKNKDIYGDKIGKLSLDLDDVLKTEPKFPKESYYAYKNFVTTVGTVGASILSTNIITPVVRNYLASSTQKKYINKREQTNPVNIQPINYYGGMKI